MQDDESEKRHKSQFSIIEGELNKKVDSLSN